MSAAACAICGTMACILRRRAGVRVTLPPLVGFACVAGGGDQVHQSSFLKHARVISERAASLEQHAEAAAGGVASAHKPQALSWRRAFQLRVDALLHARNRVARIATHHACVARERAHAQVGRTGTAQRVSRAR